MAFQTHQGRVAVVTGAARGFGMAICRQLAERGATVVAVDRDEPAETVALLKGAGHEVLGLRADVSNPDDVAAVGEAAAKAYGKCDILVNNAGIFPNLKFEDMSFEQWRQVLAVNLDSLFLMTKALLPLMKPQGWGRIVNIVSGSPWLSITGITHYSSSKMGGVGFTRGLANDVAEYGITVNAIAPTASRTPGALEGINDEILGMVAQAQAIKKIGEADDIVGTVLFLTSEDSYFVTAQTIMADGGLNRL